MADAGAFDIDLYADVDADFQAEELNVNASTSDLYDDVLTSNVKDEKNPKPSTAEDGGLATTPTSTFGASPPGRRYQLYVGNLTWWTTDADIADSVASVGVSDFIEVKFYENRANGQSKGYCCVSVGSEASMRSLMDKLNKRELHGHTPVITHATKQALMQFEAQSKTRSSTQPPPPNSTNGAALRPPSSIPPASLALGVLPPATVHLPPQMMMGRGMPLPMRGPPPLPPVQGGYVRSLPLGMRGPPPPVVGVRLPPPPVMVIPPPASHPPPVIAGPPPLLLPRPLPAPHVNPAFFPPSGPPPPAAASSYHPVVPAVNRQGLSEVEFDEIMSRNRTVSSSAIARAVQDASCSEYGSAIETLVTAISLIKQSKVANDDRCQILISSLQDTLHGIENKSYAKRERSRSRERSYHRSSSNSRYSSSYSHERDYGDRSRERDRDGYRDRSRSRERDYHHRSSREDKYYSEHRERYNRERERDRERDRLESSVSGRTRESTGRERGDVQREDKDKERERSKNH